MSPDTLNCLKTMQIKLYVVFFACNINSQNFIYMHNHKSTVSQTVNSPFSQTGPMKLWTRSLIWNASFKAVPSTQRVFLDTSKCKTDALASAWLNAPNTEALDGSPGTLVEGINSPTGSEPKHNFQKLRAITKKRYVIIVSKVWKHRCIFGNFSKCHHEIAEGFRFESSRHTIGDGRPD